MIILTHAASFVVWPGQSLQAAIDAAAPGDNITVQTGTYNENISITKGIDIRGTGGAVLVTGTLAVTNSALPVYVADMWFGKSGASGFTFTGTGTQNVRMDRCKLVGGGNLRQKEEAAWAGFASARIRSRWRTWSVWRRCFGTQTADFPPNPLHHKTPKSLIMSEQAANGQ